MTTATTPHHPIQAAIDEARLPLVNGRVLLDTFLPIYGEAKVVIEESSKIQVGDASQLTEMRRAREARLKLREIRTRAEKARVAHKNDYLRSGQAIDRVNRAVLMLIEPEERRLQEAEDFAAREEAARKAARATQRAQQLAVYGLDTAHIDLANMEEDAFMDLRHRTKTAREADEERQRAAKAEDERLWAEALARRAEADRLTEEHNRKVAAEQEKLRKAQEDTQSQLDAERKAREKAEAALSAKRREEERAARAAERARKKAEAAPEMERIRAVATTLRALPLPETETIDGSEILAKIREGLQDLAREIETMVDGAQDEE